ncbi:MAG: Hpt domain-containing protein [Terriglobia bacterium]
MTDFHEDVELEVAEAIQELVPGYLANRDEDLAEMTTLLADGDFTRISVLAHNIKGTGGSYGFPEVTAIGAALESSAKQGDAAGSGAQLTLLASFLVRVRNL